MSIGNNNIDVLKCPVTLNLISPTVLSCSNLMIQSLTEQQKKSMSLKTFISFFFEVSAYQTCCSLHSYHYNVTLYVSK